MHAYFYCISLFSLNIENINIIIFVSQFSCFCGIQKPKDIKHLMSKLICKKEGIKERCRSNCGECPALALNPWVVAAIVASAQPWH